MNVSQGKDEKRVQAKDEKRASPKKRSILPYLPLAMTLLGAVWMVLTLLFPGLNPGGNWQAMVAFLLLMGVVSGSVLFVWRWASEAGESPPLRVHPEKEDAFLDAPSQPESSQYSNSKIDTR